jgi:K+-sensing histidine kinase KdpD
LIISSNAVEQADLLVQAAAEEELDERLPDLMAQARTDPRRMVELVVKLSERVALTIEPRPDSPAALRRAHAAFAAGDRRWWAVEGEKTYQREKKRRLRAEARAAKAGAA